MLRFFQMLDSFGVQQKLQVPAFNPTQKSALGGFVTVVLYCASLAYFIFQMIDWQSNNKLPKYSSMKTKIDQYETINCTDVFAEIQFYQLIEHNKIDPFDPKNLIFQPILEMIPSNWTIENKLTRIDLEFVQENQGDGDIINKFLIKIITLQGQPIFSKKLTKIDYQLALQYCDQSSLDINQFICANDTTKQQFFEQVNFFTIQINVQQFDIKTKQLKTIPKQFLINMIEGQMQYQEFSLQVNSLNIDDGFLFSNNNKLNFFSDLKITSQQQFDRDYQIKYRGQELISVSYFQIDALKEESSIEYPKISEILADTGSIIAFVMEISFLISKYNQYLSVRRTKKEIIKMYYYDYGQYKIIKNWRGHILGVQRDGEIYKQKSILDFFAKIDFTAGLKISYINLQYELSKLQVLVQCLLTADQIKNYLKPQHLNQIGQLLQGLQSFDGINTQKIPDQNSPSGDYLQKQNDQIDNNSEIFDDNIKKSIGLFLINEDERDEQEKLYCTFLRGENQAINIESNIVR